MNRHVNAIAGRLSLPPPRRHSLEILDRVTEIVPPKKGSDLSTALAAIRSEFPTVTDFEREFPSLCFALIFILLPLSLPRTAVLPTTITNTAVFLIHPFDLILSPVPPPRIRPLSERRQIQ
jgi:hypothetical protein